MGRSTAAMQIFSCASSNLDRRHSRILAPLVLCSVFLAGALPLILSGYDRGRGAKDQNGFHLPVIRQFISQWPHLDLRNYASATTPGYHIILASWGRYVSDDTRVLRLGGALITAGLIITFGTALAWRVTPVLAIAMGLPLVCSLYTFSSGVWLLPDNSAWWGTLAILLLAMNWRDDFAHFFAATVILILCVLVRQVNIWTAGVLFAAVWIGPDAHSDPNRRRYLGLLVLCTLPAAILLGLFIMLWHGLVPPPFQAGGQLRQVQGFGPAAPSMILALTGLFGVFFLPATAKTIAQKYGQSPRGIYAIAAGVILGAVIGALPRTSYDFWARRYSGLWNAVRHLPVIANRSPLIVVLAALGGAVLAAFGLALDRRDRVILFTAFALFGLTQLVNVSIWQRYYEGFILMIFPLMASRLVADAKNETRFNLRIWVPALLLLSSFQVAALVISMRHG